MTPAETMQVAQVQTTQFNPSNGAVTPKGVDPGPLSQEVHPDDVSGQVTWKDEPVNRAPSNNVGTAKVKLSAQETQTPVPGPNQPTPTEPPKEPPAEEPKPKEQTHAEARKFAALAREAKKNAAERRELQQIRLQLERDLTEVRRFNQIKAKAKIEPLAAMKEGLGIDYNDATLAALNEGKAGPETQMKAVQEQVDQLREELAAKEHAAIKSQQIRLRQQEAEAIQGFQSEVLNEVAANQEKYPYVNFFGAGANVTQLIYDNFKRTGKVIETQEALKFAEQQLEKYYKEKAPSTADLQANAGRSQAGPEAKPDVGQRPSGARSLSNQMTVSTRPAQVNGKKSDDQRLKEAILALQNPPRS